jgi:hypothetical protein
LAAGHQPTEKSSSVKGQYSEMVFLLIHSYIGQEERIFNISHVVAIFKRKEQDLALLAHSKNIPSKKNSVRQDKLKLHFVLL